MGHATITVKPANGPALTTEQGVGGGWNGVGNPNGFPTTGQVASPMGPNTVSRTFQLPNADAARQAQLDSLGADLGPYDGIHNSCVTYCVNILREGGMDIPAGARGMLWLKKLL